MKIETVAYVLMVVGFLMTVLGMGGLLPVAKLLEESI